MSTEVNINSRLGELLLLLRGELPEDFDTALASEVAHMLVLLSDVYVQKSGGASFAAVVEDLKSQMQELEAQEEFDPNSAHYKALNRQFTAATWNLFTWINENWKLENIYSTLKDLIRNRQFSVVWLFTYDDDALFTVLQSARQIGESRARKIVDARKTWLQSLEADSGQSMTHQ